MGAFPWKGPLQYQELASTSHFSQVKEGSGECVTWKALRPKEGHSRGQVSPCLVLCDNEFTQQVVCLLAQKESTQALVLLYSSSSN